MHEVATAPCEGELRQQASISLDAYKQLFGSHPGAVTVVTSRDADRPVGFTATSVISLSAVPPLLAFSVSRQSSNFEAMQRVGSAAVHFLDVSEQGIADRFATSGIDRFAGLRLQAMPDGTPLIHDVSCWAWGRIDHRFTVDGAMMLVIHIQRTSRVSHRVPLLYQNRLYRGLSDAPATTT
jgi:flavin reductase (DIM6/NTAB) family NADH-FMN oxidoreductase RutF